MGQQHLRWVIALACWCGLAASTHPAAAATATDGVLGEGGKVFQVLAGTYSELFPGGHAVAASTPVLALETLAPEAAPVRVLVPGTEGPAQDVAPVAVYQAATSSLYLLWQSRLAAVGTTLHLAGYHDGEWSAVVPVIGDQEPFEGSARLAITSDHYAVSDEQVAEGETTREVERTVVHLIWRAAGDHGEDTFYAPVVLEDGAYLGWNPVIGLNQLDTDPVQPGVAPPKLGGLPQAPAIEPGRDAKTVVVGFTNPVTGRLLTLEIRLLPGELVSTVRELAHFIDDVPSGGAVPADMETFAGGIGSHLIDIGWWAHPALRYYLAGSAEAEALRIAQESSSPAIPTDSLAEGIGSHLIDIGARFFGHDGFDDFPDPDRVHLLAVRKTSATLDAKDFDLLGSEGPLHLIRLHVLSRRAAPEPGEGTVALYLDESGEGGLVSWEEGSTIHYRESAGEGWEQERTLKVNQHLSRERAYELLRQRVRQR